MEYVRHYYGYKVAKDFIILTKKHSFTKKEVQEMFERKALYNYMNDMIMKMTDWHRDMINVTKI